MAAKKQPATAPPQPKPRQQVATLPRIPSWVVVLSLGVGLLSKEIDLVTLRIPFYDRFVQVDPVPEPTGCVRLKGPVGAEDAVVLPGDPPILITGELDAGTHEFTSLDQQGTSASTSPRGTLWALDRLSDATPRLTPLEVPLPDGVTTMHTHGLGLHGDILFAINHAFRRGGERIERWRVTRRPAAEDGPPVTLEHLSSVTGHQGDESGRGAWTFTSRLNAAINDIAPVGPHEWYMTQFLDAPASLEGAGSGSLTGFTPEEDEPVAAAFRGWASRLGVDIHAKTMLPRLRRSRVWHCYCAAAESGGIDADACARTVCEAVRPVSTCWNGIAYRADPEAARRPPSAEALHGTLYVNDIFRRIVVEFGVRGYGEGVQLEQNRTFRAPYMVDNVHVDATSGASLWVGAVGASHQNFWGGLTALQANATAAHTAAKAAGKPTPRPHVHLRPSADAPPQPAMTSGALHIDLASGSVTTRLWQSRQLASISWSHGIGERIVMGSPWDDGVLVCPAAAL